MLSNKQKAYLRALGNKERSVFQVGKEAVSDNLIQGISDGLKANELVKFNLLKSCPISANEVAIEISSATQSEIVQIIGRTIILYKKSSDNKLKLPR
ncbi:MAG: YhbY family RNA-binding protein [Erysipelotrichaceae bacterium]|nr:YhbY family RNA-binding protein [Erysipelotrichaceae bacterium]MDD4642169.1 YhbY family RNA-binding protein [Erysipelotrichaceae bacterium]